MTGLPWLQTSCSCDEEESGSHLGGHHPEELQSARQPGSRLIHRGPCVHPLRTDKHSRPVASVGHPGRPSCCSGPFLLASRGLSGLSPGPTSLPYTCTPPHSPLACCWRPETTFSPRVSSRTALVSDFSTWICSDTKPGGHPGILPSLHSPIQPTRKPISSVSKTGVLPPFVPWHLHPFSWVTVTSSPGCA